MTFCIDIAVNAFCSKCGLPLSGKVDRFGNISVDPCHHCIARATAEQVMKRMKKEEAA